MRVRTHIHHIHMHTHAHTRTHIHTDKQIHTSTHACTYKHTSLHALCHIMPDFVYNASLRHPRSQAAPYNPNNDIEVQVPPDCDGFSSLKFSPTADLLCASNWNNSVYVWDVQASGQAVPKAQNKDHQQPVLATSWNQDGTQIYTAGCDKTARLWNLATNQSQQVIANC